MAVSKVHIEFVLDDKFSGPLRGANSNLNAFNKNLANLGMVNGINNLNKQVGEINTSLKGTYVTLAKVSGMIKALGTLGNVFSASFGSFFEYAKSFQTNAVGISGILASMTTLNGKQMQWNDALGISKDIMKRLRIEALQTAATSTDLIDTFRGLLGPGLGAGMSIDQIMKFTSVGVNAVKSMGLPSNQFLQELRGLEQGGIRASSSTLATALGLKDEDIKRAKASSEGLFNFLMKRLEGFKLATAETANTMAGQYEIVKEAMMNIGAEASESVLNTYSNALKELADILLKKNPESGMFEINPKAVEYMKMLGEGADYLLTKVISIGKAFADGWILYAGAFAGMVVAPKVVDSIANAVMGVGTRLANVGQIWTKVKLTAEEELAISRSNYLQKFADLDKEYNQKKVLISQQKDITAKVEKYAQVSGEASEKVENAIKGLIGQWKELGLSEKEANDRAKEYLNTMIKAQEKDKSGAATAGAKAAKEHAQAIVNVTAAKEKDSDANNKNEGTLTKALGTMSQFSGALSSCALALTVVTGGEEGWTQSLANGMFAIDATITGLSSMGTALSSITTWWTEAGTAAQLALAKMGIVAGGLAVAGAVAYGAYSKWDAYQKNGTKAFKIEGDQVLLKSDKELRDEELGGASANTDAIMLQELASFEPDKNKNLNKKEEKKNPFGGIGLLYNQNNGEDSKSKSAADNAAKKLEAAINKYESLQDKLNVDIKKSSNYYSALDQAKAEIAKQENAWSEQIKKMAEDGVEASKIKELTLLKDQAVNERYLAAERDFNKKLNDLNLNNAQNTMLLGGTQDQQYQAVDDALQIRKRYYEELLADEELAKDKRIEFEIEYANTVKQIRDNNMYNYKTAWQATLQELSMQQINYGEHIKSVFSTIESAGTNLLTSTENFGTKIKTFFSDVAASIMSEMAKIIMKGLITKAILSVFNIGGSSPKLDTGYSGTLGQSGFWDTDAFHAKGGVASGWSIVGEQGPELVNFTNPGRVYTAQQTANALSQNGNGNLNIKFDIKNETGTAMEAQQTGSSFDGESYVIGVVLKAMANNTNGMRSMVKGLANA